jgi:hypothetical protein
MRQARGRRSEARDIKRHTSRAVRRDNKILPFASLLWEGTLDGYRRRPDDAALSVRAKQTRSRLKEQVRTSSEQLPNASLGGGPRSGLERKSKRLDFDVAPSKFGVILASLTSEGGEGDVEAIGDGGEGGDDVLLSGVDGRGKGDAVVEEESDFFGQGVDCKESRESYQRRDEGFREAPGSSPLTPPRITSNA